MPEDSLALEILRSAERAESDAATFRALYQSVAEYMLPRSKDIISKGSPGSDHSLTIYDNTAQLDLQDMVSGLCSAFFPDGQPSFGLTVSDPEIAELDHVERYLAFAAERAHEELFKSNFMLQLNEALAQCSGLGTCNIYSEWHNRKRQLNYKAWDIGSYTFKEDALGQVDTVYITMELTARQAQQLWGDNAGEQVNKAAADPKTSENSFKFVRTVRPRKNRNRLLRDRGNMAFEDVVVNQSEKRVVEQGGFDEFPFAIARWTKSPNEIYGRGQGTIVLSQVRQLQAMTKSRTNLANKMVDPPLEVLSSFEGDVRLFPGARNNVMQLDSIRGIQQSALGNFPISDAVVEAERQIVHRAFFADVFAPLANLTGDRRTQLEIIERVKQAMKKLAGPVYRLQTELFTPLITRSVLLLIRNGRIPAPPPELQGADFGVEYLGELALAMRDQQARAFRQYAGMVAELAQVQPDALDTINFDEALPDIGVTLGMKVAHLATPEQIAAKRQARAQQMQAMQAMQGVQVAADAYAKGTKAPEPGSATGQLMESA